MTDRRRRPTSQWEISHASTDSTRGQWPRPRPVSKEVSMATLRRFWGVFPKSAKFHPRIVSFEIGDFFDK